MGALLLSVASWVVCISAGNDAPTLSVRTIELQSKPVSCSAIVFFFSGALPYSADGGPPNT